MPEGVAFEDLQKSRGILAAVGLGGLVALRTGTINTAVLHWAAGGTGVIGGSDAISLVNSTTLGSSVEIRTPGIYVAELGALLVGDELAATIGISQDVAAAGLANPPSFAIAGFLDALPGNIPVATGITYPLKVPTTFEVTAVQARQVVGGVTGSVIRFHATGDAGAPGTSIGPLTYFRLRRIHAAYS